MRVTYDASGEPIFFAADGAILTAPPVDMPLLWQSARWDVRAAAPMSAGTSARSVGRLGPPEAGPAKNRLAALAENS